MFSAWWLKVDAFFLFLMTLLSLFLLFFFLLSTGKRYPFTSLVPNTQNYVTGTMKFQHVLLTYSDLWALPPPHTPPPQQPAHTFSFTFFFFSNFIAKSVWNLPYERQNSPFSILFWPFPAVAKTRRMNAFCASWELMAVKPREQIKELDRCRGLTFVFIVIMVVTLEGDVLSFRKWNSVIWNRGGWASNALV